MTRSDSETVFNEELRFWGGNMTNVARQTRYPMTVARRGRWMERLMREARRFFFPNAQGHCDTCHAEDVPVCREDTDEGWQECIGCAAQRFARREMRRAVST